MGPFCRDFLGGKALCKKDGVIDAAELVAGLLVETLSLDVFVIDKEAERLGAKEEVFCKLGHAT